MKRLLVLFLFLFSVQAAEKDKVSLSNEQKVVIAFDQFKACREESTDTKLEIINCVSSQTTHDIRGKLSQRISMWLHSIKNLGSLEACSPEEVELFPLASTDDYSNYKCVNFETESENKRAIFYFASEDGMYKVKGIQFF